MKPVLDACCGSRMFWFDPKDPRALFVDCRQLKTQAIWKSGNGDAVRYCTVDPDLIADFRALPFPAETFWHVVFDPPHLLDMGDWFIRTAPDLMDAIMVQEKINARKFRKASVKYEYPDAVITSAKVGYFCKHHVNYAVKRDDCAFVRKLDEQGGKTIFGGGYILSECAEYDKRAAEVAAHNNAVEERAMAELADAQSVRKWSLSDRERELQKYIGSKR